MSDNTIVFFSVVLRSACVLAALAGAVYLASMDRPGWGWLIFTALVLGSYSLKSTPSAEKPAQAVDISAPTL